LTRILTLIVARQITVDRAQGEAEVLMLARRHRLTVYDASYLALAQRESVPLATLDGDLREAAKAERISLLEERSSE